MQLLVNTCSSENNMSRVKIVHSLQSLKLSWGVFPLYCFTLEKISSKDHQSKIDVYKKLQPQKYFDPNAQWSLFILT